ALATRTHGSGNVAAGCPGSTLSIAHAWRTPARGHLAAPLGVRALGFGSTDLLSRHLRGGPRCTALASRLSSATRKLACRRPRLDERSARHRPKFGPLPDDFGACQARQYVSATNRR